MSDSTSVVTWNIIGAQHGVTLHASIIGANATATTVAYECPHGCGHLMNATMTVGPWAEVTPAPPVSRGTWGCLFLEEDLKSISTPGFVYSEWCGISDLVATQCWASKTGTTYELQEVSEYHPVRQVPLTITAGLEKLISATPTLARPGPMSTTATSFPGGGLTKLLSSSTAAAQPAETNAAPGPSDSRMGTLGLLGLVATFLLR
ncbi:hypothetical protein K461DRAFT_176291 [Myriangium duriaei CBS 260.36]|uniref:Uncharacterized protein n=1 Tax=Myriangium duriaei CBS 260.36 TaxID=1168546 RepID=A0A9P4J117_9PEZI|nr:hypothetical protein K461DRAFT_176291 [Myriangium duriaei CBS 260.36]